MRLDHFSNPVFNEQDLFTALYKGQSLSADMFVDSSNNVKHLEEQASLKFWLPLDEYDLPVKDYDFAMQAEVFMPASYFEWSPEEYCMNLCTTEEQRQRVRDELTAFENRGMITLLQWLKYFVDTMRANQLVWGVGRGSSVASYVLFLIGVHKIDSLKYNLDWQEFLR